MSEEIVEEKAKGGLNLSMGAWIGIAVAALVVGILIGHFAMGGGSAATLGKTTITEAELDQPVATLTYNNTSVPITAREVITQESTVDSAKQEDGTFAVPSADTVLSLARNKVIAAEADARGITVSDDDVKAYAEEQLGTNDLDSIASSYGIEVEIVSELIRQSAIMNKLHDEVVTTTAGEAPEAPEAPEVATTDAEGNELPEEDVTKAREEAYDKATKDYAEYIIKLAGDEWDADKGAFVAEDGPYATALAEYKVTKDGASYNAAQAAYYVAYQDYTNAQTEASTQWSDFVNDLLSKSSLSLSSLIA